MTKLTAAQWFAKANGKQVRKTVVEGRTWEDWPEEVARAKEQAARHVGYVLEEETEEQLTYRTTSGQLATLRRCPMRREVVGLFEVRSKDYSLTPEGGRPQFGDKKGADVQHDGAMIKVYPWGALRFEILEG